jgi:hypothetical protein
MVGIACHVSATVTLLNATSPQENVLYGRFSSFLFLRLNCPFLELYPQHSRRPLRALRSGLSRKRFGWYSDGLSDLRMPVTSGEQQVCLCAELCSLVKLAFSALLQLVMSVQTERKSVVNA